MNRFAGRFHTVDEKEKLWHIMEGYYELGMYEDAIRECKKLMQIDPDNPELFVEWGYYYEEKGKAEKAIRCYKYAIKRFPKNSKLYAILGYCFNKYKKRTDMAITCYDKALELDPLNEWAISNIGAIAQKEGRRYEALLYYLKAYGACKQKYGEVDTKIAHNLARAYYRCKQYKMADALLASLLDDCSDDYSDEAQVYCDYGRVNFKVGTYGRALELFEKALSLEQDNKYYKRLFRVVRRKITRQALLSVL